MKNTVVIIPARYGSKRYKGKPLIKILGREMVLRVADICKKAVKKENLYIATDDQKIAGVAKNNKYNFIMTSKSCLTGTDRVAEASKKINAKIYVNVQGDEPTINSNDIKKIISAKKIFPDHVICGYSSINKNEIPESRNIPKVVLNSKNDLVYISRSLIPGSKKKLKFNNYFKQVCIYAFSRKQLNKFYSKLKKSNLEKIEDIEILRFFELGIKIKMVRLNPNSVAVDEKKDVKKVEKVLLNKS